MWNLKDGDLIAFRLLGRAVHIEGPIDQNRLGITVFISAGAADHDTLRNKLKALPPGINNNGYRFIGTEDPSGKSNKGIFKICYDKLSLSNALLALYAEKLIDTHPLERCFADLYRLRLEALQKRIGRAAAHVRGQASRKSRQRAGR